MASYNLDKIDLRILRILQTNGRITNLQLSNEIGLSPAPTLERVKKLEKSGLIKSYHAELDRVQLGLGIHTYMQVTLQRHKNNAIQNFENHIRQIEEIVECNHITGEFDYLMKIFTRDMAAYERLVMDKLSKIEEIGHMQTHVVLSTIKKSDTLPLEY